MTTDLATPLSLEQIRQLFPALSSETIFLENAGGSQVPAFVANALRDYLLESFVQLGAGYPQSITATDVVAEAHRSTLEFMNGTGKGQAILGPSTTQLCYMLAECYSRILEPGDEVIIAETAHEANAGPWAKLDRFGMKVKVWRVNPETYICELGDLSKLLTDRTRIVAFPHVSNLLGDIVDVKAITELAHSAGARVVVDGVAYAPHRAVDVSSWDVDWYVYSTYKVFGPHMAALFGKTDALAELEGPNHFFIPRKDPYKFELGGCSHEGCAALLALRQYWNLLSGELGYSYQSVKSAFDRITDLELPLQQILVDYLLSKPGVRVIGPQHANVSRVPTISFTNQTLSPAEIVRKVDQRGIGIRFGHMYAYRLCKALGIDNEEGVVRVSAVHYNTPEEMHRLIAVLQQML